MARASRLSSKASSLFFKIFTALLVSYLLFILVRMLGESVVLDKQDRLNMVLYGPETYMLSFGLADNVHYIISFSQVDKVSVPGGYGRYNVGALGKLAQIEKDPDLIGHTFSSMTSMYTDYYVLPKKPEVYDALDTENPSFSNTEIIGKLFSSRYQTNANLIDKAYISFLLLQRRQKDFIVIRSLSDQAQNGEVNFSERRFTKKYKGFFYHQSLRSEGQEVQIIYSEYAAALTLSRVIEGQGIRVVDLTASEEGSHRDRCLVVYSGEKKSKTVHFFQKKFNCDVQQGENETADIKLIMGADVTEVWK